MPDVHHAPDRSRFEYEDGGEVAVLTYELGDEPRPSVALLHTVVPVAMEGQGVGSRLAAAAVGWAREEGREVVPVCSFVQGWLERHPEALTG